MVMTDHDCMSITRSSENPERTELPMDWTVERPVSAVTRGGSQSVDQSTLVEGVGQEMGSGGRRKKEARAGNN